MLKTTDVRFYLKTRLGAHFELHIDCYQFVFLFVREISAHIKSAVERPFRRNSLNWPTCLTFRWYKFSLQLFAAQNAIHWICCYWLNVVKEHDKAEFMKFPLLIRWIFFSRIFDVCACVHLKSHLFNETNQTFQFSL